MASDHSKNGDVSSSFQNKENAIHPLSTVPTSVTLSAEQFERLYLTPMTRRQSALAKQVGNPTPLGPIIFLGGLLLLIGSILEFILGNTFPCVVFGTIGGFWFAFAATMIPSFNAAAPYSASATDTAAGLASAGFMNTYAFLFITMAVLMLIFLICATRTNVVYTLIFLSLLLVFLLLSGAYWDLGEGNAVVGERCVKGAGAALFVASLLGFYLLIAQLFEAMAFPFHLPIGDLTVVWKRKQYNDGQIDVEDSAAVGDE
ncbi:hypothetical protein N7451_002431 [Penicillium sp. IBT 35674x]|nr:hypothetical protein N7451_002431 [Penicillium sp. IBT 35674x]